MFYFVYMRLSILKQFPGDLISLPRTACLLSYGKHEGSSFSLIGLF